MGNPIDKLENKQTFLSEMTRDEKGKLRPMHERLLKAERSLARYNRSISRARFQKPIPNKAVIIYKFIYRRSWCYIKIALASVYFFCQRKIHNFLSFKIKTKRVDRN